MAEILSRLQADQIVNEVEQGLAILRAWKLDFVIRAFYTSSENHGAQF